MTTPHRVPREATCFSGARHHCYISTRLW